MRPHQKTWTVAAAVADGYVNDTTGATAITLLNSGPGDGLAHQCNITASGDISLITFTFTGTDADGVALVEALAGPAGASTVETTGYFKTMTSITKSATMGAETADIGWVDEFVTPTLPLDTYANGISANIDITGTIDYTVQATNSDMRTRLEDGPFNWFDVDDPNIDLIAITADVQFALQPLPRAIRLKANSYTSTPTVAWYIIHNLGSPP